MIPAHDSPLAVISFSSTGTLIATASEKGTVIRVFRVSDGTRLHEFRRGVKRYAKIYSLAFSADSMFLGASSNTETVHIFRLESPKEAYLFLLLSSYSILFSLIFFRQSTACKRRAARMDGLSIKGCFSIRQLFAITGS